MIYLMINIVSNLAIPKAAARLEDFAQLASMVVQQKIELSCTLMCNA